MDNPSQIVYNHKSVFDKNTALTELNKVWFDFELENYQMHHWSNFLFTF